jgi:hypothetical protein
VFSLTVVAKKKVAVFKRFFLQPLIPFFLVGNIIIESGINQKEALIPPDKHLI